MPDAGPPLGAGRSRSAASKSGSELELDTGLNESRRSGRMRSSMTASAPKNAAAAMLCA